MHEPKKPRNGGFTSTNFGLSPRSLTQGVILAPVFDRPSPGTIEEPELLKEPRQTET